MSACPYCALNGHSTSWYLWRAAALASGLVALLAVGVAVLATRGVRPPLDMQCVFREPVAAPARQDGYQRAALPPARAVTGVCWGRTP